MPDDFTCQKETHWDWKVKKTLSINPFKPKSDFPVIDFTRSNARQFYSSKEDPLGVKGLKWTELSYVS